MQRIGLMWVMCRRSRQPAGLSAWVVTGRLQIDAGVGPLARYLRCHGIGQWRCHVWFREFSKNDFDSLAQEVAPAVRSHQIRNTGKRASTASRPLSTRGLFYAPATGMLLALRITGLGLPATLLGAANMELMAGMLIGFLEIASNRHASDRSIQHPDRRRVAAGKLVGRHRLQRFSACTGRRLLHDGRRWRHEGNRHAETTRALPGARPGKDSGLPLATNVVQAPA